MSCCYGVGSWLWACALPASKPANATANTALRTMGFAFMVFSPSKIVPVFTTTLTKSNTRSPAKFHGDGQGSVDRLEETRIEDNYFTCNDLWTASKMPFTNAPESSEENFLAKSTASFRTTLGGVSVPFIS